MTEIDLTLPAQIEASIVEQIVERCCAAEGLINNMKGLLKKYPGSIHWHFKRERQAGTLEITLWPKAGRLWLAVQPGRTAPWLEEVIPNLRARIEAALLMACNSNPPKHSDF
jgi:hypothetical protein